MLFSRWFSYLKNSFHIKYYRHYVNISVADPENFAPDPDPAWIWPKIDKFQIFL